MNLTNQPLDDLYQRIRQLLLDARQKTYAAVNFAMVESYWQIGRMIVEVEQGGKERAEYGTGLIKELSRRLSSEFGTGFDVSNLKFMRLFYKAFQKGDALRHQLSWTHYRLLSRVGKENARNFYLEEAIACQWGTRELARQINTFYYERLLASQDKKGMLLDQQAQSQQVKPEDLIKDPYVLEFLGLQQQPRLSEKELEQALIDKLQAFLLELGKGFAFLARQKRITTDTKHFYIDLVFYNVLLKCYVLIDLKIGELTHGDIGQMDMYVRYYEDRMRIADDNPTIGIILCSEKDEAIVKYSVLEDNRQLFASKYMLYLPTEEELARELRREVEQVRMEATLSNAVNKP
jgi:predicted nuclease of restriction endonuclease-like (RecB) superfamily